MWYDADLSKLAVALLPTMMRSERVKALVKVLVSPLLEAWCVFMQLKKRTDDRLNITCHVLPLEAAMNKACGSDGIWIESVEQQEVMVLHFEREVADRVTMRMMSEGTDGQVMWMESEWSARENFIVHVPDSLCTSLDSKAEDEYGWEYLRVIENILNNYKPAGRTYRIELYNV